jgi:hypothetical protein
VSHIAHEPQPTPITSSSPTALEPQVCKSGRCHNPRSRRGLCDMHADHEDRADEMRFFLGFKATDERIAAWMGVHPDTVERFRFREQARLARAGAR